MPAQAKPKKTVLNKASTGSLVQEILFRHYRAVLQKPNKVKVAVAESTTVDLVDVTVAKEDLGRAFGTEGRNIKAVTRFVDSLYYGTKRRAEIEVIEAK